MDLRTLTAGLALCLLAACGSGGSDTTLYVPVQGSPQAGLFAGPYHTGWISAIEDGGSETFNTLWGQVEADGVWDVQGAMHYNWLGSVGQAPYGSVGQFAVESDRRFTFESQFAGHDDALGVISATGDLAILAGITPDTWPTIRLFGRRAGVHDDASLSGTWRFAGYSATAAGANTAAIWGTVAFDGAGGGSSEMSVNSEGATFGPALRGVTYAVAPDGSTTLGFAGGLELEGGITGGGDVLILGGSTVAGDHPNLYVFIRAGAGLSDADLVGGYGLVGMTQQIAGGLYTSLSGHFEADGMGWAEFAGLANHEGAVALEPTTVISTFVGPTGALSFVTPGGDSLVGALSPDGRFGMFCGPTNAGSDPSFFLILR